MSEEKGLGLQINSFCFEIGSHLPKRDRAITTCRDERCISEDSSSYLILMKLLVYSKWLSLSHAGQY